MSNAVKNQHKFSCNGNTGFRLPLPNGYSVAVQFGLRNYCEHHCTFRDKLSGSERFMTWRSVDAETSIIDPSGMFVEYKKNNIQGRQSVDDVFETIMHASKLGESND